MATQLVDFSVIIPTYNRPEQLRACLGALAQQTYLQSRFEVIVVNDGGSDLTAVVDPFRQALTISLITQANSGPGPARNRGALAAQGQFLAFTDDDCLPRRDWLQQLFEQCQRTPQALVGGRTFNQLTDNLCSTTSQAIVDVAYRYFNPEPDRARFFASNNMTFPRRLFLELGGFHPSFRTSEDREICDRWSHAMVYNGVIQIDHAHALTLTKFWQQHLSYGEGAFHYHTIRARRGAAPFRPDFSFHGQLLAEGLKHTPLYRAGAVVGLMFLSQLASTVGYFTARQRAHRDPANLSILDSDFHLNTESAAAPNRLSSASTSGEMAPVQQPVNPAETIKSEH